MGVVTLLRDLIQKTRVAEVARTKALSAFQAIDKDAKYFSASKLHNSAQNSSHPRMHTYPPRPRSLSVDFLENIEMNAVLVDITARRRGEQTEVRLVIECSQF